MPRSDFVAFIRTKNTIASGLSGPNYGPNSISTVAQIRKSMSKLLHSERSLIFLLILIIFSQIWIFNAYCLTNLDYHLSKSKYAEASLSDQMGFHGPNSVSLSVVNKGTYSRVSIYLDDPMPLEELDLFSMWINPQLGNGKIQLDLLLDGDGSDSYDSKSSQDARVRSISRSWSDLGMSHSQWNELDGFDLDFEKYGDKSVPIGNLDDFRSRMKGLGVVRIYITLYKDPAIPETTAFIDYIKIGDEIISFEPLEEEDIKDGPKTATPGGQITYTITYGNNQMQPTDLVVSEEYDSRTVFIDASPEPDVGANNIWTFRNLPPGSHGQIKIIMRTVKPAAKANIDSNVHGQGLTSTRGMFSTNFDGYPVTNCVKISAGEFNFTDSVTTIIKQIVGSNLVFGEHGSGSYQAEELLDYNSVSISAKRDISASFSPCSVNLSQRSIPLEESWSAGLLAENDYRDLVWSDRYFEASLLNLSYKTSLGKTLSYLETSGQITGIADRSFKWPNGAADLRLHGNFTLHSNARWKKASTSVSSSPPKDELECCPMIQEPQTLESI